MRLAEKRNAPILHLMVGLPGSGKTTEAKRIEAQTGAIRFTPDEWQIELFGTIMPTRSREKNTTADMKRWRS